MNVYPYKTIKVGKFTKYQINITENGSVLIEYYFKNKIKSQTSFQTQNDIKTSSLPKHIKNIAQWASYEFNTLSINIDSPDNKWF